MPGPQIPTTYRFHKPLRRGLILSRPNRFIMIVKADKGTIRCHCPTTGRLGDLDLKGLPCLYSTSGDSRRKTAHTVEAISTSSKTDAWVGINQNAANRYFEFFLRNGSLSKLANGDVRREVRLGKSRIDFQVGDAYIEVKTPLIVLLTAGDVSRVRRSRFDSFNRLIRHMGELRRSLRKGAKAKIVLCFLYDAKRFVPPKPDKTNRRILAAARAAEVAGVERWQANFRVDEREVSLIKYFRSRAYAIKKERTRGRSADR